MQDEKKKRNNKISCWLTCKSLRNALAVADCAEKTQIAKPAGGGGGSILHYEIPLHSLFSPTFTSFGANLSLQWPACPKLNTKISPLSTSPTSAFFRSTTWNWEEIKNSPLENITSCNRVNCHPTNNPHFLSTQGFLLTSHFNCHF